MKDQNLNQEFLKWDLTSSSISAETTGRPAASLEMDCNICVLKENGIFSGVSAKGLWDTGTSTTVITPAIAERLKLPYVGGMSMNGLGGKQQTGLTIAFFRFPNRTVIGPIRMAVHELPSVDVLIGMDIISMGTFHLERKPDGGTLFTFDLNL